MNKFKYEVAKVAPNTITKEWLNKWCAQDWELFQMIPVGMKILVVFRKAWDVEYEAPL
jgi:hypothetical protein